MLRSFSVHSSNILKIITTPKVTTKCSSSPINKFFCTKTSLIFNNPKIHSNLSLKNVYINKNNISTGPLLYHFKFDKKISANSILNEISPPNFNFSPFTFTMRNQREIIPKEKGNSKNISKQNFNYNELGANYILFLLISVNIFIFLLWQLNLQDYASYRKMQRNFTLSQETIDRGYYWTLITANFSQRDVLHLAGNMIPLYFLGKPIAVGIGPLNFLSLYVMAGVFSCFAHLLLINGHNINRKLGKRIFPVYSDIAVLGASGSVFGIATLCAILYPRVTIYIYGVVPVPMIVFAVSYTVWEIIALKKGYQKGIAHESHLGGAVFGLMYYFFIRKRLK